MKTKTRVINIFIAIFLLCTLSGCVKLTDNNSNETSTIWTLSVSYSDFYYTFGETLGDGYYIWSEISTNEWRDYLEYTTNATKHSWKEANLQNYLLNIGFDKTQATKNSVWLSSIDHGYLASRTGNIVYLILK